MAAKPLSLPVWDRKAGKLVQEFMDDTPQTYETQPHRSPRQWLESTPLYDWFIAFQKNMRGSKKEIEPFIQKHQIDMTEFKPVDYLSYAEFFEREFKEGARGFPEERTLMGAYAEARYFGWDRLRLDQQFPVKGHSLRADELMGNAEKAQPFHGGPVLLTRLSPVDYHHLHYFDDGRTIEHYRLGSRLWTVNWKALQNQPDILFRNERLVSILETQNFGRLAFIEIGALSVGRIVQKHPTDRNFERGAEKSVFRFGGSAVAVFGEPGRWCPADDILKNTEKNIETFVRLGDVIAAQSS